MYFSDDGFVNSECVLYFSNDGFVFQYGGNPVSCAISLAVLDVLEEEGLLQHAKDVGGYLTDEAMKLMEKHPIIGDVRYGCHCIDYLGCF